MTRRPETVLVRVVAELLDRAEALGLDRVGLVRLAGLSEIETKDPDARLPVSKEIALWHLIALQASDPAFGIRLGAAVEVRKLGLVGYAMYYSSTLEEALRRLVRFGRVVNEATRLTLEVSGPHVSLPRVTRTRSAPVCGTRWTRAWLSPCQLRARSPVGKSCR